MKKPIITTLILAICTLFLSCTSCVFAETSLQKEPVAGLATNAKAAVIADFDTGTIVLNKNGTEKLKIASMTKMMTLLVAYDCVNSNKCSLDDNVSISSYAAGMGGSQAFIEAGSVHKLSDLIKTVVIASANDSSVAIAEHTFGSVENFVFEMNKKASQLNLKATHFVNCTGLPALNHYSCAQDCVTMLSELIRQKNNYFEYSKIWLEDYKHPSGRITTLTNTNKLVRFYNGCDGGKTGYTNESLHCLCATAKRGNTRLIACVLGEPDSKTRFAEVSAMFNFGFGNFETRIYLDKNNTMQTQVKNGKISAVEVAALDNLAYFGKKGEENGDINVVTEYTKIKAPIKKGDIVGKAFLVKDGKTLRETELVSLNDIDKKTYFDYLSDILNS